MANAAAADPGRHPLEATLGHRFNDPSLLTLALTHPSLAGLRSLPHTATNQRLEFLGDRVLGLIVVDRLLRLDAAAPEGLLSRRLTSLVNTTRLAEIGLELGLDRWLQTESVGRRPGRRAPPAPTPATPKMLADVTEAVIGAVYLDDGLRAAAALVERCFGDRLQAAATAGAEPKSALQEWAAARGLPTPVYTVKAMVGPDHAPAFAVEVRLPKRAPVLGRGGTKRQAEQAAAAGLLAELGGVG